MNECLEREVAAFKHLMPQYNNDNNNNDKSLLIR